jgi:competence protein ComEA
MPPLELSRRRALVVVALLLVALLLAGRLLLRAGTPHAAPAPAFVPAAGPAVPQLLVVDVVGAVRRPGLLRLAKGSRIADAVARAGGTTRRADLAQVNLAAPLADGEQVVVPALGVASTSGTDPATPAGPVHLSTATAEQFDSLPGVGPVTAQKIIDYRTQHGAFASVDELDAIPGIGPAKLDQLRGLVVP